MLYKLRTLRQSMPFTNNLSLPQALVSIQSSSRHAPLRQCDLSELVVNSKEGSGEERRL